MTPLLDTRFGAVRLLITGRSGGSSRPPFAALNLSLSVGDQEQQVIANRAAVAAHLGIPVMSLVFLQQVHGDRVLPPEAVAALATADHLAAVAASPAVGSPTASSAADAAVVSTSGVAVAVTAADCLPLLFADRGSPLAAAAHVGRRGLVAGVALRCLTAFTAAGAVDPVAVLGPCIAACCYEVAAELRDEVDARAPGAAAATRRGSPALDLRRALRRQLGDGGLPPSALIDVPRCTAEDDDLFSYRRDRVTGRFAGVVAISPPGRGP